MSRKFTLLAPILLVSFAACNDATGPSSGELTATEARALAVAIDNGSSQSFDPQESEPSFSLSPSPGPLLAVTTRTDTFNLDLDCPRGGSTTLAGEHALVIDTDEGFITVNISASKGHTGCVFRTDQGIDITVDGTVEFSAERELREGLIRAAQSHSGLLDYSTSDGKEGTCAIDIATEFSFSPGSASRTIAGSVCGHTVDVTTTWTHTE